MARGWKKRYQELKKADKEIQQSKQGTGQQNLGQDVFLPKDKDACDAFCSIQCTECGSAHRSRQDTGSQADREERLKERTPRAGRRRRCREVCTNCDQLQCRRVAGHPGSYHDCGCSIYLDGSPHEEQATGTTSSSRPTGWTICSWCRRRCTMQEVCVTPCGLGLHR